MKALKKLMTVILSLSIILGGISFSDGFITLIQANAYPEWQTINGVRTKRCTWYAWQLAYERTGVQLPNFGNGGNWLNSARNYGYSTGTEARVNSIAVWQDAGYGHVGFVDNVYGDKMHVLEGGRTDLAYNGGIGDITLSRYVGTTRYGGQKLVGFIYLQTAPAVPSLDVTRSGNQYTLNWSNVGADYYTVVHWSPLGGTSETNVYGTSYTCPMYGEEHHVRIVANKGGLSSTTGVYKIYPTAEIILGGAQNLGQHFYAQIGFSNNTYLMNVNNNAQLGKISSANKGIFEFTRNANGSYTISDVRTKKRLDVTAASALSGANIQFYQVHASPAQNFFIRKFGNGYSLQAECSPYLAINVYGGNFVANTNIQNYGIDLTAAHKLYIRKGGIKIPAKVKGYTGTYDGKTHTISISNVPSGSTIYYRTSTKANWTTKKPVRKSAGTTTVYYKISNNHYSQTLSGSAKISIKKASQKGYAKSYNGSYTGKAHTITLSSVASGSKVYYRTSTKAKWSTKKPTRTSVGTTKVYYKIVNSNCTSTKYGTAQITNKKAVQKAKAKSYNGNYNGKAHTIGFSNVVAGSKAYYRTSTKGKWTTKKPTRTSIGTTKVYYKIVNRNCTKTVYGSAYIKINKGIQKPVVKSYYGNYNAKSHTISISNIAKNSTVYYRTSSKGKWTRTKPYRKSVGTTTVYYKITNKNYTTKYGTAKISIQRKVTGIKLNKTLVTLDTPNTYQLKATITPSNATNKKVTWTSSNPKVATVSSSGKVTAKTAGTTKVTAKASSGKTVTCTIRVNQKNVYISNGAYALVSPNQQFALTTPGTANFSKLNVQAYGGYNSQIWNLENIGGNAFVLRSQLDYNKVVDIYHINADKITAASEYDTPPTYSEHVEGHAYLNPYTDPMADEWQATKLYNGTYIITLKQSSNFKLTRGGDYDANGNSVYLYHWNAWQQTYWKLIKLQ